MSKTQKYMNLTEQEKKELDKQTGREIAGFGLIITIVSLIFGIIYLIVGQSWVMIHGLGNKLLHGVLCGKHLFLAE